MDTLINDHFIDAGWFKLYIISKSSQNSMLSPPTTESELDIGLRKTQELFEHLMELARLSKAAELLADEIEVTRRRVNALEYILIPSIKETISYISSRLEEMERSFQVQLMRVKEIVRGH